MNISPREIELARRLHELLLAKKEPMEIREGGYVLTTTGRLKVPGLVYDKSVDLYNGKIIHRTSPTEAFYRDELVLLPSWERCREFLRGKGWTLDDHCDGARGIDIAVWKQEGPRPNEKRATGDTDGEAILAVCAAVAEEA